MSLEYPNPEERNINSTDSKPKVLARLEDLKPIIDEVNALLSTPSTPPGGGTAVGVVGSGTVNYLSKFTPNGTSIGDSQIYDDGTQIGFGTAGAPDYDFHFKAAKLNGRAFYIENVTDGSPNSKAVLATFVGDGGLVNVSIGASNSDTPGKFVVVDNNNSVHYIRTINGNTLFDNDGLQYQYLTLKSLNANVSFGPRLTQPFQIYDENTSRFIFSINGSTSDINMNQDAGITLFHRGIRALGLPTYADNAAALAGGLVVGDVYKTAAGELRIFV